MSSAPGPQPWRRVEALFYEALEHGPESRGAFLDQSCAGDAALRREVEELLAHTDQTIGELRRPVDDAMRQFVPAAHIGPFRLVRVLGEGGMGTVYLAERADEEYRQQVAIKLMRADLGRDAGMLRRFRAERQILADLNHPHIARLLHGGTSTAGAPYLVMEYVDGIPIDQYCAARNLSIDDRLRLFLKVCSAVEYAHLNKVIHRDLKPANILVDGSGEPKLLDFGIAKLLETPSGHGITEWAGRLLTPEYASPEQVRGEPLTQATDIYSLGIVLYELVEGRHPLKREKAGPRERPIFSAGKARSGLDEIVLKAMHQEPASRYTTAAELADDLRAYLEGAPPRARTAGALMAGIRWKTGLMAGVAAAVLAIVAAAVYLAMRSKQPAPFLSMQISRVATRGNVSDAAISADGKFVAYFLNEDNRQSLWLAQLAANSELRMLAPETGDHISLSFAPDGNYLYYLKQEGVDPYSLYRLPILGGAPRLVLADAGTAMSFAPDGKRVAFLRMNFAAGEIALMVASADGSGARVLAVRRRPAYFARRGLAWSPDGKYIACFAGHASFYGPEAFHLITIRASDGQEKALTQKAWTISGGLAWMQDGRHLIASVGDQLGDTFQIWEIDYPGGASRRITNDLANYSDLGVTWDGETLIALTKETSSSIWVTHAGSHTHAQALPASGLRDIGSLAWNSRDEIMYSILSGSDRNIWTVDAGGGAARQLTTGPGYRDEMAPTPDGRYVLYTSSGKIWRMDSSGANPRQLTHGALDVHASASADSRWAIYTSFHDWSPAIGGTPTLWKVPIDGGDPQQILAQPSTIPQVSPDGKLIAYVAFSLDYPSMPASGVSLMRYSGEGPPRSLAVPPQQVQWSGDGQSLLYIKSEHGVGNIWRQSIHGGPPVQLTAFASDEIFHFAVARDGQLAISRGRSTGELVLIKHFH